MSPRACWRLLPLSGALVLAAACGRGGDAEQAVVDVPATVALGEVPQPVTGGDPLPTPPPPPTSTLPPSTTVPTTDESSESSGGEPLTGPVGRLVDGDRVLVVGDALMSSAAPRNGGLMCDALTVFGWETEIDAEAEHDLDFAESVLDERLDADGDGDTTDDWDIVVFVLGSEVDGTDTAQVDEFRATLDAVIDRVAPRPVVLLTLPEGENDDGESDGRAAINEVIRTRPESHNRIAVLDFAELGGPVDEVQAADGLTFTSEGSKRLSLRMADLLGEAPDDDEGECLGTLYNL